MKLYRCYWILLLGTACVHEIYRSEVDLSQRSIIDFEVVQHCKAEQCWVDRCWMETQDLIFCKMEFSFTDRFSQTRSLAKIAAKLEKRGINIGLCGKDSKSSQLTEAFVGGFIGGATSAALSNSNSVAIHSSSYLNDNTTSDQFDERLSDACSEGSILEEAAGNQ